MKLIYFEANSEELSSNRRIADALVDCVDSICDAIVRGVDAATVIEQMNTEGEQCEQDQ